MSTLNSPKTEETEREAWERQVEELEVEVMAAFLTWLRLRNLISEDEGPGLGLFGIQHLTEDQQQEIGRALMSELEKYNDRAVRTNRPALPDLNVSWQRIYDRVFRMGKLQPLLDDLSIEEIIVDAPDKTFVILVNGQKRQVRLKFSGDEEVRNLVSRLAASAGRHIDEASPLLDLQLPSGERLNAVIPPITRHVAVTIRKHSQRINSLDELVERNTLTNPAASFLSACVAAHLNILVCGGTASGKTSMLNCLGARIDRRERVIVIEETGELQIERVVADTVVMQSRPANIEGKGEVSLWQLVKNSLRQRPTWIVIGEVRGSEALEMLLAITSGHAGMCTLHANDSRSALSRLATLAGMSKEAPDEERLLSLIGEGIQLVVHLRHESSGGLRQVDSIIEVVGREGSKILSNELFRLENQGGLNRLAWSGLPPRCLSRLQAVGLDWDKQIVLPEEAVRGGQQWNS